MGFSNYCCFDRIYSIQKRNIFMNEDGRGFLRGSLILLISFGIFNVLNFLFQLIMARSLSIAEYGVLATLFSILYITNVMSESIQLVITKYSSSEESKGKLK